MCKVMEDLRVESFAEGRKEGREEGRQEGRQEGEINKSKAFAAKLHQKGYSIEEIADMVEYSTETVAEWLTPKAG